MEKVKSTRPPSLSFIGIEDGTFISQADGFSGTIKMRPEDFIVNEIDPSGAQVEVSSFIAPRSPSTTPHSALTSAISTTGDKAATTGQWAPEKDHPETDNTRKKHVVDGVKTAEDVYGPSEQLRQLVGSEGLARLAAINSAAKGCATSSSVDTTRPDRINGCGVPNTEASDKTTEDGSDSLTARARLEPGCVRIPGGQLADKAERAKVHRAVQEAFPFVKTTTDRGPEDAVMVVCTRSEPHPALRDLLSDSDLEAIQRMVNRGPNAQDAGEGMALVCDPDREHRTRVHRAVSQVHPYLQTKTKPDSRQGNALTVFISWKKRLGGAKRKRQRCASVEGDDSETHRGNSSRRGQESMDKVNVFVRFALRKEEREHHRVAAALSKVLRVPLSALSFAGMKDKMAITTQACVVRGVPPDKILASNGSIASVTVGNLSFCYGPLSVGELSGNRFSITIRGVSAPGEVVERAVREASSTGFINFFGTQRVGSPSAIVQGMPLPYQIGNDMLAGEWEAAARKVLFPRDGDSPAVREALTDLRDGKIGAKECLRRVKGRNRLFQENAVLQGLARFGDSAYREAFQRVPYAMRTLWVRAYQSHVWNSMASERIRLLGPRAAPGDLIILPDCTNANDGNGVEASGCAVVKATTDLCRSKRHGVRGSGVKEVVTVLTKEKMDSLLLEGVTAEELLRQVVLPLPGRSVQYPSHQIGDLFKRRLDQDGVNPLMWCHPDPVVPIDMEDSKTSPGSTIDDSCTLPGRIVSSSPVPENALPLVDAVRSNIDFVGSAVRPRGAYRRLLCFPDEVCWEETPLLGRPDRVISLDRRGDGKVAEADEAGRIGQGCGRVDDIVISFTLPAGSFATMFLREVMKSDHDVVWGGLKEDEEECD